MIDKVGVHAAHCCKVCGCKYGDENCPVFSGEVKAIYDCWECEQELEDAKYSCPPGYALVPIEPTHKQIWSASKEFPQKPGRKISHRLIGKCTAP